MDMPIIFESLEPRRFLSISVREIGRIGPREISESSGVFASRVHPGILYTHNDAGNAPILFAINARGALIGRYTLNVPNVDWEDVAADAAGHLFIADTGNNDLDRDVVVVHRLAEPAPTTHHGGKPERRALTVERSYSLRWPAGAIDAEALVVSGSFGYLITKRKDGGSAEVYRFVLGKSKGPRTLKKIADLPVRTPVTGADLSARARTLAVVATGGLYLFKVRGNIAAAGQLSPQTISLPTDRQIEGITFSPTGGLFLTAESRELYAVTV
jgi:hypothetical protein